MATAGGFLSVKNISVRRIIWKCDSFSDYLVFVSDSLETLRVPSVVPTSRFYRVKVGVFWRISAPTRSVTRLAWLATDHAPIFAASAAGAALGIAQVGDRCAYRPGLNGSGRLFLTATSVLLPCVYCRLKDHIPLGPVPRKAAAPLAMKSVEFPAEKISETTADFSSVKN